jgi:hypothetical protein
LPKELLSPAFGNGHQILHLTIKGDSYLGLFGRLGSGAEVRNLGVVDVSVVGSGRYVGGLTGSLSYGTVIQCYSTGAVNGDLYVGGLVGSNSGTITQCYSTAGGKLVGGNEGQVTQCYSISGGLAGYIYSQYGTRINVTTTEMMDPYMLGLNGFANDPNWVLDAGRDYPRLAWEGKPGDIISEPEIDWLEGQGTPDSSYQIDTADQLILLSRASILWDKNFVLGADIDLDLNLPGRKVFIQAPIPIFEGVFDGKGHTISHLTIDGHNYLGLFGRLKWGAEVRNLGVVDVNIIASIDYVGGLVGQNVGSVAQCYSTGVVSGNEYVGGLVGQSCYGSVVQCYSSSSVSGRQDVGGIVGFNGYYSQLTNCWSNGSVSGHACVGGLVGYNYYSAVTQCYSTGTVADTQYGSDGGLVGYNRDGTVTASFWDTGTSGQPASSGGTGKTTSEMQKASTFLEAGWDFMGETANGTEDIWWILEGQDYPRLWWEAE